MRPNFALNLSTEGIVLLHRSSRGTWTEVGDVALEDPKLRENLSFLRGTAVALEGKGFGTKLIVPAAQVLFTEVDAPGPSDDQRLKQIKAAMVGLTPYEVADLVFDWRIFGTKVQLAIIAKETLDEAEEFAIDHRFNPLSFVSQYTEGEPWEPFFGSSDYAVSVLGLEPDVREGGGLGVAPEEAPIILGAPPLHDVLPEDPQEVENIFSPDETDEEDNPAEIIAPADKITLEETAADKNISAEIGVAADGVVAPAAKTPQPEAAFSSRRPPQDDATPNAPLIEEDRPIKRLESRIIVSHAQGKAPQVVPSAVKRPALSGSKRTARPESPAFKARRAKAAKTPQKKASGPSGGSMFGKILSAMLAGLKRKKPPEVDPGLTAIPTAAMPTPQTTAKAEGTPPKIDVPKIDAPQIDTPQGDTPRKNKPSLLKSLLAAVIFLGLIAGLYAYLVTGPDDQVQSRDAGITEPLTEASLTQQDLGITAKNRTRPRPEDLETSVTLATLPTSVAPPAAKISNIRPQPRSTVEGQQDPDADLPDTVAPLEVLTQQELDDILAAGLPEPTLEEIIETGEPEPNAPLLDPKTAAKLYDTSGILQALLNLPQPPNDEQRDDIFVAAIDRALVVDDAIALPDFTKGPADPRPLSQISPVAASTSFEFDERGLVKASKSGTLSPEGILIFKGKPRVTPPNRPKSDQQIVDEVLAAAKPRPRPKDLKTGEDAIFVQGGLTMSQLRTKRPPQRPKSAQDLQIELAGDQPSSASDLAVLTSFQPGRRPADFAKTVEKTKILMAALTPSNVPNVKSSPDSPTRSKRAGPVIPTRANVAKLATQKNVIDRSKLNLIGVYGTPSKRRALMRLPSGRFVKVEIGDRIDGGRIAAIGAESLSYVKKGRNRVLKIPN